MTSRHTTTLRAGAALLALGPLLGACGGSDPAVDRASGREVEVLEAAVPVQINGLDVVEEDITEHLEVAKRPYLDAAALYSFRKEDELQATLQIGRFADDARYRDDEFLRSLVGRVGTGARRFRVGDQRIWLTGADRQTLAIWFKDRHMFVMSTRQGFDGGRGLLRAALGIEP